MKKFMNLEYKLCKELEQLEEKYRNGSDMSEGDLRRIDLLVHSMKSLATYTAMKEAEDAHQMSQMSGYNNSYSDGNSYNNASYRGRESMERYTSNDMRPEGYSPYMYPQERRW